MTAQTTGRGGEEAADTGEGDSTKPGQNAATFPRVPGTSGMNTFLKVFLIVVGVIVAVKLLPIAFGLACGAVALLAGLAVLGVSLVALLVCAALLVATLLSPIWLPVAVIVGIIALCRRNPVAKVA